MSASNPLTSEGRAANPNAQLIIGLRAVAVWLEEHPELPELRGNVYRFEHDRAGARERMEMIGAAMPNPTESATQREVVLRTVIDGVSIRVYSPTEYLNGQDTPPAPVYPPVLRGAA